MNGGCGELTRMCESVLLAKNAALDVVVDVVGVCIGWIRMSRVRGGDSFFEGLMGSPPMGGACDRPRSPVL